MSLAFSDWKYVTRGFVSWKDAFTFTPGVLFNTECLTKLLRKPQAVAKCFFSTYIWLVHFECDR